MPGEDGYQFFRRVRAMPSERGGSTPAVALTAFAGRDDRDRSLAAGYQVHLSKPVDGSELAVALLTALRASPSGNTH
jgi:CheY-like chemotaxis protein